MSKLRIPLQVGILLLAAATSFAAETKYKEVYKGQILPPPCPLVLRDGFYMGLGAGYDMFRFANEIPQSGYVYDRVPPQVGFSADAKTFVGGSLIGGFAGFGKQFYWFYNTYLGLEVYGFWSTAEGDASIYTNSGVVTPTSTGINEWETDYQLRGNYGIDVLPGIMLNRATLFYLRLGYNWASMNLDETIRQDIHMRHFPPLTPIELNSNADNEGGFHYGLGIEGAFADKWSLRAEYNHTDIGSIHGSGDASHNFSTGTKFTPSDNQFLLNVIYHFYI